MELKEIIYKTEEKKALAYEKYKIGADNVPLSNAMQYYMDLSNIYLNLIAELKKLPEPTPLDIQQILTAFQKFCNKDERTNAIVTDISIDQFLAELSGQIKCLAPKVNCQYRNENNICTTMQPCDFRKHKPQEEQTCENCGREKKDGVLCGESIENNECWIPIPQPSQKMKIYSEEEIKDEFIGKVGTPNREKFEKAVLKFQQSAHKKNKLPYSKWKKKYFIKFIGRWEDKYNPDAGNWSEEQLKEKYEKEYLTLK